MKRSDHPGLKSIRVAVIGDTSTQFLVQALRGAGYDRGLDLEIWEAEYDQIERQIQDPGSDLYNEKPEFVVLYRSSEKLLQKYYGLPAEEKQKLAEKECRAIEDDVRTLHERLRAKVILFNYAEIDDGVFGNFANRVAHAFLYQLRLLNVRLMQLTGDLPDLYLCDLSSIQNRLGRNVTYQAPLHINADMSISVDALSDVAYRTIDLMLALNGKFRKCIILDLDNTLWGGVVGDDGLENLQIGHLGIGKAFTALQHWVKALKERGVIVAVCSKNNEATAKEVFEKHPDMVLRLDDIAVFVANWNNKVDNIRHIQQILNIGFDAMVFLDDQPFERNMVREHIPEVCVPELPEDPAEYLPLLAFLNLFETVSISQEDAERTRQYREEALRTEIRKTFANEDEYLQSLEMVSAVEPFTKFNIPRVAQLSQRSNQFNLRTIRYTEADIERIGQSAQHTGLAFSLEDKFGDHGLISVVIATMEEDGVLFIENWFMSCRVLKRGMEEFMLNTLMKTATERGCKSLKGEYIPTPKNEMVREHYLKLGFREKGGFWHLDLATEQPRKCFIQTRTT